MILCEAIGQEARDTPAIDRRVLLRLGRSMQRLVVRLTLTCGFVTLDAAGDGFAGRSSLKVCSLQEAVVFRGGCFTCKPKTADIGP